ncbi:Phytocyanin domain [Sesbania bispinosa]|nr:Phytocyanin domain [Sesbania bispinosa]
MATKMVASFLVLHLAFPTVFGTDYNVGDDNGWSQGVDYSTWTSGKTFKLGDNLVFKYGSLHSVDEVNENDYKSCSSSNSIKSYSDGNSKVPLTTAGKMYFICPTPGHCGGGMKLEINVVAASTTPSGTPPTTPSGSPPTTPSGSPPTTPSGSPPTTPSSPSESGTPPPPKPSGAVTVSSGITLLMGSIILGFIMG